MKLATSNPLPVFLVTVPLHLQVTDILNGTKSLLVITKVTSDVAEPLLYYIYRLKKLKLKRQNAFSYIRVLILYQFLVKCTKLMLHNIIFYG